MSDKMEALYKLPNGKTFCGTQSEYEEFLNENPNIKLWVMDKYIKEIVKDPNEIAKWNTMTSNEKMEF